MLRAALITTLLLLPSVTFAGDDDWDDGNKKSYLGDANAGWFHIGGGVGATGLDNVPTPQGRMTLGAGGYTFGFYGGGQFDVSFNTYNPVGMALNGVIGVHIPVPIVHPLLGIKVGPGMALSLVDMDMHMFLDLGAQLGFIIRGFDSHWGFRFMVEPAWLIDPATGGSGGELMFTFAFVM